MNKFRLLPGIILIVAGAIPASAQLTIDIVPAIAPNVQGSPSTSVWVDNAISALYTGAATAGTPGTPGYYERATGPVDLTQILVTSFPSWLGTADPGNAFGPAFAGELGNRLHFGLVVDGHGQQFAIGGLSFTIASSDPDNVLGWTFAAGTYSYNSAYVGVLFGPDGKWGGGDDTFVTSGPGTQLVDGLVARGSGNAFWPQHTAGDGLTDQEVIDQTVTSLKSQYAFPVSVTGQYTVDAGNGNVVTAEATVTAIPEPSAYAAFTGLATAAVVLARRWRRRAPLA